LFYLSKPQAWHGINALAHCMESPKAYGITRKRASTILCGLIPYRNKLRIPYAHYVSDSIHGFAVIWYEGER